MRNLRFLTLLALFTVGLTACAGAFQQERVLDPAPRERAGMFDDVWSDGGDTVTADSAETDPSPSPASERAPGMDRDVVRDTTPTGTDVRPDPQPVRTSPDVLAVDAASGRRHGLDVRESDASRPSTSPSLIVGGDVGEGARVEHTESSRPWWRPDVRGWFSGSETPEVHEGRWVSRFEGTMSRPTDASDRPWDAHPRGGTPPMTWSPLESLRDTVMVYRDWPTLETHLVPGRPLVVRGLVWPEHARVASRADELVRIESSWVPFTRFADDELRCELRADPEIIEEEGAFIRLVALVSRHPGGHGVVETRMESTDSLDCQGSDLAQDRVQSFRWDMWMAVNRASTIGTQRLPRR